MTAIACKILGAMKRCHRSHILQPDNDMIPAHGGEENVHKSGAFSVCPSWSSCGGDIHTFVQIILKINATKISIWKVRGVV